MRSPKPGTLVLSLIAVPLLVAAVLALLQWRSQKESRFDRFILEASRRYNLDPALIKAVIWQESKFDPTARGAAGEIGLMQIREDAAWEWAGDEKMESFHHEIIVDPRKNILCGSYYLSKLLRRYTRTDNPVPYALADYNAGRTHVLRWNKGAASTNSSVFLSQIDYPGTRRYAIAVMEKQREYQSHFSKPRFFTGP